MFGYSWVREGQNARRSATPSSTRWQRFDIEIEGLHTETGPGVYEVAIRYDEALRAADKAALFKTAMKQIAARPRARRDLHGEVERRPPRLERAPAPVPVERGGEERLRRRARDADGLSRRARHYLGGQLALMPELTALYSPTINSYKRYVPGVWAPLTATWGVENRTCAIRVDRRRRQGDARRVPADGRRHQPVHRDGRRASRPASGASSTRSSRRRPCDGDAGDGARRRSRRSRARCATRRALLAASNARARDPRRRVRRSLRAHARLGGAPVRARRHRLGAPALLRGHLTCARPSGP